MSKSSDSVLDKVEAILLLPERGHLQAIRSALELIDDYRTGRALIEQAEMLAGERCPQCGQEK